MLESSPPSADSWSTAGRTGSTCGQEFSINWTVVQRRVGPGLGALAQGEKGTCSTRVAFVSAWTSLWFITVHSPLHCVGSVTLGLGFTMGQVVNHIWSAYGLDVGLMWIKLWSSLDRAVVQARLDSGSS